MRLPVFRRSKYGSKRQHYGGRVYHSGLEARVAERLDTMRKARDKSERVVDVKCQVPVEFYVGGVKVATWKVDFQVTFADGRQEWWEAKGFETADYRIKKHLFEALYPDRILKVVRA